MSILRNILLASGAMSAGSIGYFGNWVHQKSQLVPQAQRGNLFDRMREVSIAAIKAQQLKDDYTSKRHVDTVATLSSKESASEKIQDEMSKAGTSYFARHLQKVLQVKTSMSAPIFVYIGDLSPAFPPNPGTADKGFAFLGSIKYLSPKSRGNILNGNYIRCHSQLSVQKSNKKHIQYHIVDALITGTKDRSKCHEFQKALLKDAAVAAMSIFAKNGIDDQDPISDAIVLHCSKSGCLKTSDMTTSPDHFKSKGQSSDFTNSKFVAVRQTCLAGEGHKKKHGSVIVGISDMITCSDSPRNS